MPAKLISRKGSIVKAKNRRTGRTVWGYVKTISGRKFRKTDFATQGDAEKPAINDGRVLTVRLTTPPEPALVSRFVALEEPHAFTFVGHTKQIEL